MSSGCLSNSQTASNDVKVPLLPESLPAEVVKSRSEWVVSFERATSNPVSLTTLEAQQDDAVDQPSDAASQPSRLLKEYLQAAHVAFSWTPQAMMIRAMLKEQECRDSFTRRWIQGLSFGIGDLVNGVYEVSHYAKVDQAGAERVELLIHTPPSYTGPPVRGLILSVIEPAASETAGMVVFVNETWLWRKRDEKPTLLESRFGKWFHGLLASWLVVKGMTAVFGAGRGKDKTE